MKRRLPVIARSEVDVAEEKRQPLAPLRAQALADWGRVQVAQREQRLFVTAALDKEQGIG
jgi:hypothetical protein